MERPDQMALMLHGALGRVRAHADTRREMSLLLTDALRAAHKAGATTSVLMETSGLSRRAVERVLRGQAL